MREPIRVGARGSRLSLLQAEGALARLRECTGCAFELCAFSSPGDRDQATDLRVSPGDFFTRDLDEALLRGEIDCAIHSAKDLPPEGYPAPPVGAAPQPRRGRPSTSAETEGGRVGGAEGWKGTVLGGASCARLPTSACPDSDPARHSERGGLDWFWLPWREDPRDCLVARVAAPRRIGVSSGRRDAWAARRFPEAERVTLRGAIPERLAKLDAGEYDAIVVAAAALHRLGLQGRISEYIPLDELTPPPGQGVLALTFRRDDPRLRALRNLFLKTVRFVGAGVGDAELCTLAGLRELRGADCVIYDALMDAALLAETKGEALYVGKRSGAHALRQAEITALIGERVRRGERVVRLKGGDPGLFGRLTEETDALAADGIPFRVWPGVSALAAATTATGMLLTRRGESRGFRVETPRSEGADSPDVYFMALGMAPELARRYAPQTPCAVVYDAGAPGQEIVRGTVGSLLATGAAEATSDGRPGLILVGGATRHGFAPAGPLAGRRVWITGSPSVADKARAATLDFGGVPVVQPLVRFEATATVRIRPSKAYTLLMVTSPTAARCLLAQMTSPIQYLPKRLAVTGPGTAEALRHLNIDTLMPAHDFSAKGLLAALPEDLSGQRILRVRSEEAGPGLAEALRARGARVKDLPIYRTRPVGDVEVPSHEAVFLASSSAAEAWLASDAPHTVDILAMGQPTAKALRAQGVEPTLVAPVQTVREVLFAYALHCSAAALGANTP